MRAHLASSAASGAANSENSARKIESPCPTSFQASSAVKLKKGAIQRSMACVSRHSAVCALRRASEWGAVV